MQTVRNIVMLGIVLGCAYLALAARRRLAAAEKPQDGRRFGEARVSQARERWDGEGGVIPADA